MEPLDTRRQYVKRWAALQSERASFMSHWKEISDVLIPRSGRFFVQDRNRGEKRHNAIYDSTGTRALRVLAAGMMSGMTSPARPWFRLDTPDQDLMKFQPVKLWLSQCTRIMQTVFQKSNTYRTLHSHYQELGAFGTCAGLVLPDFENIIHHFPLTTGEYAIATNWKGEVNTLYREFDKTVAEVVGEFGIDNCSSRVQTAYGRGEYDTWITLLHIIEPRLDRDVRMKDSKNMPWRSVYLEQGHNDAKFLRESGFSRFPSLAARWDLSGGDIYGNSPGMEALGDIKGLQLKQLRKAEGIDYQTRPPLQAPSSLQNRDVDALPGGITYYDASGPSQGIRSMFNVELRQDMLLADIQDGRRLIQEAFSSDLFLMLSNTTDSRKTATEVAELHEEKMLMLGPTVERLSNEMLNPLVDTTFARLVSTGVLPPPPQEMHGQQLNVEYTSILAQAQRAIATNGVDRFVGNLGQIAAFKPDILDKFNADAWADQYADMLGVDPELIMADDKVAIIRSDRAKAQQAAQQAAMANSASQTAKNLGQTPTNGGNAASDVMNLFSGYTTPQQ